PEMDQAEKLCLSKDKGKEGVADINSHSATDLDDLDTLLKLANEAEEINTRVYYLLRGVSLANDKELFRRAIDILNKMTEEERKIDQSFWDELRYTISAGWAFQQYNSGDVKGSLDTLNEVPENTRPFARTGFAMRCKPDEVEMRP